MIISTCGRKNKVNRWMRVHVCSIQSHKTNSWKSAVLSARGSTVPQANCNQIYGTYLYLCKQIYYMTKTEFFRLAEWQHFSSSSSFFCATGFFIGRFFWLWNLMRSILNIHIVCKRESWHITLGQQTKFHDSNDLEKKKK